MKFQHLLLAGGLVFLVGQSDCGGEDMDGDGWTTEDGDCNDRDAEVHPGAEEACDGVDNDCDGEIDEDVSTGGVSEFAYTGDVQTFTVPECVTSLSLEAYGAEGVAALPQNGYVPGKGAAAAGVLSVNPGDVLYIYVGGQDGYNGGASGWGDVECNGGGASDVRLNGTELTDRVIVAGGGGGVGGETDWGDGGDGGGGTCGDNYCGGAGGQGYAFDGDDGGEYGGSSDTSCHGGGGGGGGYLSGGSGAADSCYGATADDGTLGEGGDGAATSSGCCENYGVGGGGGGYYGGGGAAGGCCGGGGGGGGSSWTGSLTSAVMTGGAKSGDGSVVLTY